MEYESLLKLNYKDPANISEIYQKRINNECATVLDFSVSSFDAFYLTNQEMLLLITKIMSVDRELSDKVARLPNIALNQFTIQSLIDEIKQTNDIENVYSTKKEIRETYKKISKGENKGRFKGLVSKYLKFRINEEIKLGTCEDIRTLYNELVLDEVLEEDKDNAPDGVIFRKDQVNVHTSTGKIIHSGVYPEAKIIDAMNKALKVLNDDNINYLVSAAIFHYMFAYIHPFYDGNGRTDRFISSYIISRNLNHLASYKFSYIIKKHQKQYYKMFSDTNDPRNKGDITPFIIQFLELILELEKELTEDIDKRVADLNYYSDKINTMNLGATEAEVAYVLLQNALFDDEGLTKHQIGDILHLSFNTISKAFDTIQSLNSNIIRCVKSGNRKLYDINLNELADM
jgi:Fic family protein